MNAVLDPGKAARTSNALQRTLRTLHGSFKEQQHELSNLSIIHLLQEAWPTELDEATSRAILFSAFTIELHQLEEVTKQINVWAKEVGLEGITADDLRQGKNIQPPAQIITRKPLAYMATEPAATKQEVAAKPAVAREARTKPATQQPKAKRRNGSVPLLPERLEYLLYIKHGSPSVFCQAQNIKPTNYYNWKNVARCPQAVFTLLGVSNEELLHPLTDKEKGALDKPKELMGNKRKKAPVKHIMPPAAATVASSPAVPQASPAVVAELVAEATQSGALSPGEEEEVIQEIIGLMTSPRWELFLEVESLLKRVPRRQRYLGLICLLHRARPCR